MVTEDQLMTWICSGYTLGPGHLGSSPSEPTGRWAGGKTRCYHAILGSECREWMGDLPKSSACEVPALAAGEP